MKLLNLSKFLELFERSIMPNFFTESVGKLIKDARIESGFSQKELSENIFSRQATLSDIENGKRMLAFDELLYLSFALNKPLLYFVPTKYRKRIEVDSENNEIKELALISSTLTEDDLSRLIIQARALSKRK